MTYLAQVSNVSPDAAIQAAVKAAIASAVDLWKLPFEGAWPRNGIGIAPLSARAVAATDASTSIQSNVLGSAMWGIGTSISASTWTDWINLTIHKNVYIVWTGLRNLTQVPKVQSLGVKANGQDLPRLDITQMYSWQEPQAYLHKPIVIRPENNFTVRVLSAEGIAAPQTIPYEQIGLLGYLVAKNSYLFSES